MLRKLNKYKDILENPKKYQEILRKFLKSLKIQRNIKKFKEI